MDEPSPLEFLDWESPGLTAITSPARGTGQLIYDPPELPGTPKGGGRLPKLYFKASPWVRKGVSPVAWQLIPGDLFTHVHPPSLGPPTVTVVCARSVALAWDKDLWNSGDWVRPRLNIIRVQDAALVPIERTRISLSEIIRDPYPWWSARGDTSTPFSWWMMSQGLGRITEWDATVRPFQNGVQFIDDKGDWQITLRVDPESRAGFAYQIEFPQDSGFFLRCVCTANVKIEGYVSRDRDGRVSQIVVQRADVDLQDVPAQGAVIDASRYQFRLAQVEIRSTDDYRLKIQAFEWAIYLLPLLAPSPALIPAAIIFALLGPLYDAANAAWVSLTGHTVWGETKELTQSDMAFLGVGVALTLIPAYGGALARSLSRAAKARLPAKLLPAFEGGVKNSARAALDPRLVAAIEQLTEEEQKAIARTLEALAASGASPAKVIQAFLSTLSTKLQTASQVERVFLQVFSQDLSAFRIAELEEGFRQYVSKGGASKALQWAAQQRVGKYADVLSRIIGPKFATTLGALERSNKVVTISKEALALIAKVDGTFHHYRDLRKLTAGLGPYFEVDHLVEKRFLSASQFLEAIDQEDFMAMIVAKDAQIARQIPNYMGYSHLEKTLMMRRLIPHGSESFVTAQQFWDAHAHSLLSLGVDEKVVAGHFKREIQFLLKSSEMEGSRTVNYRLTFPKDHFTRSGGWNIPQLIR